MSSRDLYEEPDGDYLAEELQERTAGLFDDPLEGRKFGLGPKDDVWQACDGGVEVNRVDKIADDPKAQTRKPLRAAAEEEDDFEVLVYDLHIARLGLRPAPHPRPLSYKGAGFRYTQVRCCECHNHEEIEPRPKRVPGEPKKYQSIGIAFGDDKAGYGPSQEYTKPAWKRLPPRWVPWIERATRSFEQAHPKPKEETEGSGYASIDMEPQKGEFELNDHGRPTISWGWQVEKDERAETARRALRSEDINSRSRGTVREQAKRDPELLACVLAANPKHPKAEGPKLFKADDGAVMARAGLYEYALLPSDRRNWKEQLLFRDPEQLPRELRRPLEKERPSCDDAPSSSWQLPSRMERRSRI